MIKKKSKITTAIINTGQQPEKFSGSFYRTLERAARGLKNIEEKGQVKLFVFRWHSWLRLWK